MKYSDAKKRRRFVHDCVYGESGTGKSTLVSQLAEKKKLIWLACDGQGYIVIDKLPLAWQENVDIVILPDTRDSPIAHDTVRRLMKGTLASVCHHHGVISCSVCARNGLPSSSYEFRKNDSDTIVVVDHATRITDSYMANVCKGKDIDYKPKLDDWGSLRFHLASLMGDVQAARFNVVVICQAMQAEEEDKTKKLMPSVGSYEFGRMVNQFFDDIVYCEVVNGVHKFGSSTTYSMRCQTKSRRDIDIASMKVPSLLPFFDLGSNPIEEGPEDLPAGAAVAAEVLRAPVTTSPPPVSTTSSLAELMKLKGLK